MVSCWSMGWCGWKHSRDSIISGNDWLGSPFVCRNCAVHVCSISAASRSLCRKTPFHGWNDVSGRPYLSPWFELTAKFQSPRTCESGKAFVEMQLVASPIFRRQLLVFSPIPHGLVWSFASQCTGWVLVCAAGNAQRSHSWMTRPAFELCCRRKKNDQGPLRWWIILLFFWKSLPSSSSFITRERQAKLTRSCLEIHVLHVNTLFHDELHREFFERFMIHLLLTRASIPRHGQHNCNSKSSIAM